MKFIKYKYYLALFAVSFMVYETTLRAMEQISKFDVNAWNTDAYSKPIPGLSESERAEFLQGRSLVRQVWTIPPSEELDTSGLGPLYNRISCIACHHANGRGFAPDSINETMKAMLVRLSVKSPIDGAIMPHHLYGDQLNEYGVPGVKGEGRAMVRYAEKMITLADGTDIKLRKPDFAFIDLAYGPITDSTMISARIAPAIHGLGLIDAVDESEILRLAKSKKPAGITGRPNYVWDEVSKKTVVGKFGWKANAPNLKQQIASAFIGDMGITSSLFPNENCTSIQKDCQNAPSARKPELEDKQLDVITFYHTVLAVPATNPNSIGAALFEKAQCIHCHVPVLKTSSNAQYSQLRNRLIHPYTDLLLHDMGAELADNRPDHLASGSEWRTPPLWGIGLAKLVNPKAGFLHDGRARSVLEAILWHGGEAQAATDAVRAMSADEREALIAFIESI